MAKHVGHGGTLFSGGVVIADRVTFSIDDFHGDSVECPFSILADFARWFQWHRRVIVNGEDRLAVSVEMTGLLKRLEEASERRLIKAVFDYSPLPMSSAMRYGPVTMRSV